MTTHRARLLQRSCVFTVLLCAAALGFLTGCATTECPVVCLSPSPRLQCGTGQDAVSELNRRSDLAIGGGDYGWCRRDNDIFVWVVLNSADQERTLRHLLRDSNDFRLLSVGYVPLRYRALFASQAPVKAAL